MEKRCRLRSETSEKYPIYEVMLSQAIGEAASDKETLTLPVDVEEELCPENISKAVCAFRMADNVVETFGREESCWSLKSCCGKPWIPAGGHSGGIGPQTRKSASFEALFRSVKD